MHNAIGIINTPVSPAKKSYSTVDYLQIKGEKGKNGKRKASWKLVSSELSNNGHKNRIFVFPTTPSASHRMEILPKYTRVPLVVKSI